MWLFIPRYCEQIQKENSCPDICQPSPAAAESMESKKAKTLGKLPVQATLGNSSISLDA
jgi:hypothetical protein